MAWLTLEQPERVPPAHIAGLEAFAEGGDAVGRAAVGERVGHDAAGCAALDRVVADRPGGPDGLVDVAGLEDPLQLLRVVSPDAGVKVRLKLELHRDAVGL